MKTAGIFSVIGLCLGGLVGFFELSYYFSHPYAHGVAPHLIGLSVAVVALGIAQFIGQKD
jgi:hypothetical protein